MALHIGMVTIESADPRSLLSTKERAAEVEPLRGIGASVVDEHRLPGCAWTVLTDPGGSVFYVGAEE